MTRKRIIDFAEETAVRGEALLDDSFTYAPVAQNIAGRGPCVIIDIGGPIQANTWTTLPENFDADQWRVKSEQSDLIMQTIARYLLGARIKLWHDDVRRPPDDSWMWARSNAEAMEVLNTAFVHILSMDHDLGGADIPVGQLHHILDDPDMAKLDGNETGVALAEFIGQHDLYPEQIIIHSMNPVGAGNILAAFQKWSAQSERNSLIRIEPFRR